jgi:hypothetical protein
MPQRIKIGAAGKQSDGGLMQTTNNQSPFQIKKLEPKKAPKLTLKQILRADQDVRDFYKLIDEFDLRTKAVELLESRLAKSN